MKGIFSKSSDWEAIYPIGSIYMSANSTSPATLFGGTWTQLKDQFLLCAGSTYSAGSTGGSANTTLTTANMPAHAHTRGTMDITGGWAGMGHTSGITYGFNTQDCSYSGAFFAGSSSGQTEAFQNYSRQERKNSVAFQASRSWTGETSSVGSGTAFSNMPPYLAVYVWKRTA